jgi:hypothetical protein
MNATPLGLCEWARLVVKLLLELEKGTKKSAKVAIASDKTDKCFCSCLLRTVTSD